MQKARNIPGNLIWNLAVCEDTLKKNHILNKWDSKNFDVFDKYFLKLV